MNTPRIHTVSSYRFGSVVYLLVCGDKSIVIDTGHPNRAEETLALLKEHREFDCCVACICTHGHADHVGAAALLKQRGIPRWSFTPVLHPRVEREHRELGITPVPSPVDRVLQDREDIELDGTLLTVIATPGHADDHLALFLRDSGTLFAGDLFGYNDIGTLNFLIPASRALREMESSVARVAALKPKQILPGHGTPIHRPRQHIDQCFRRLSSFNRNPGLLIGHTLMPYLLLYLDSRPGRRTTVDRLESYVLGHLDSMNHFIGSVSVKTIVNELQKALVILEMTGTIGLTDRTIHLTPIGARRIATGSPSPASR